MATPWFCSDLHLGHDNILRWRTEFSSADEHNSFMVDSINDAISKRDTLYILGDSAINHKGLDLLREIKPCFKKVLVLGNHDIERGLKISDFFTVFDSIHALLPFKEFWLSHPPIHPNELRGRINLHGHVHSATIPDSRYFNLCPENLVPLVGRPIIKLDEIREIL